MKNYLTSKTRHLHHLAAAMVMGASLVLSASVEAAKIPTNYSSHSAQFFMDLLSDRVFVYESHNAAGAAAYFGPDGLWTLCYPDADNGRYMRSHPESTWKVTTHSGSGTAVLDIDMTAGRNGRWSIFYDGETGAFHTEGLHKKTRTWKVVKKGWIQDSWPAALTNACAGFIDLSRSVQHDRAQDSLRFEHMKTNATPVRQFPGWKYGIPGATGYGATGGPPTMTLEEARAVWSALPGRIVHSLKGARMVIIERTDHWEMWQLDPHDNITNSAVARLTEDGSIIRLTWDRGRPGRLRVGYPLAILTTPGFHPAFAMMQDLAHSTTTVTLAGNSGYLFAPDGTVTRDGSEGRWWLSRGNVYVEIDGETIRYSWREFARQAGWSEARNGK